MLNAALSGKPDVGNPHVGFDKREVASYPPSADRPEGAAMGCEMKTYSWIMAMLSALAVISYQVRADVEMPVVLPSPQVTIDVPSGVDDFSARIDAALRGAGLTSLEEAASIVKTGSGELVLSAAIPTTVTAEFHIMAGTFKVVTTSGASAFTLGDTSHGVYVHSGATLETFAETAEAINLGEEPVFFEGDGAEGKGGALFCSSVLSQTKGMFGRKLTMTDDATVKTSAGGQDLMRNGAPATGSDYIDMQGHVLSLDLGGFSRMKLHLVNPGHIASKNGNPLITADTDFRGDASNEFRLVGGTLQQSSNAGKNTYWTLSVERDTTLSVQGGGATMDLNCWYGPVNMKKSLMLGNVDSEGGAGFNSLVYGPGGFTVKSTKAHPTHLGLACPSNSFSGGVTADNASIDLYAVGALPANGGAVSLRNSKIVFSGDALGRTFELPTIDVTGSSTVENAGGAWGGAIVKAGAGELSTTARAAFRSLDLQGGSLLFGSAEILPGAGLYGGSSNMVFWAEREDPASTIYTDASKAYYDTYTLTNGVYRSPELAYVSFEHRLFATYTGYVWNRAPTNETWSFAYCYETCSKLIIDGEDLGHESVRKPLFVDRLMTPGAHSIQIRLAVNASVGRPGGAVTNANSLGWPDNFGIAYDRRGRGTRNASDYEKFEDPGDGSLFTLMADGSVPSAYNPTLNVDELKVVAGTSLELGGASIAVSNFLNATALTNARAKSAISNSTVSVFGRWTLDASDVVAGNRLATDRKLAFAEGATFALQGNQKLLAFKTPFLIATAEEGIEGVPMPTGEGLELKLSDDGKSLYLTRVPYKGMMILFR